MKIKKYEARTEKEAIQKVKDELGMDALILNIKTTNPKGFFSFLRKPVVEVTAAYQEKIEQGKQDTKFEQKLLEQEAKEKKAFNEQISKEQQNEKAAENVQKDKTLVQQSLQIESLQNKLNNNEELISKLMTKLSIAKQKIDAGRRYDNSMIQLFYETLIEQEVTEEIAASILDEVDAIEEVDKIDINLIVKVVYNKIINILGSPENAADLYYKNPGGKKGAAKSIVFLGPTGVGKTTTIAKLSSIFILKQAMKVALATADTYRIAAVDQLRTYAEILGVEVTAIYQNEELINCVNKHKKINDLILIDTAGRSHKNEANIADLQDLLSKIPDAERCLVLSVTTKFEDLKNIVESYEKITDFKIIFTKLDETNCLGSILNICYLTGKKVSYLTTGQSVPDDIELMQPEKIARALLGLGGVSG